MTAIIGLDPGKTGGLAYVNGETAKVAAIEKLTDREVVEWIEDAMYTATLCVLENPTGSLAPGPRPPKSIAGPAESYGFLRGVLAALGARVEIVRPQVWQRKFNLPSLKKCGTSTVKKRAHRQAAERIFPGVKVTNAVADALLLCAYGQTLTKGEA